MKDSSNYIEYHVSVIQLHSILKGLGCYFASPSGRIDYVDFDGAEQVIKRRLKAR